MTRMHRREFLSKSRNLGVGAAVGWTILKNAGSARGTPANEKIVLGLIGAGGGEAIWPPTSWPAGIAISRASRIVTPVDSPAWPRR